MAGFKGVYALVQHCSLASHMDSISGTFPPQGQTTKPKNISAPNSGILPCPTVVCWFTGNKEFAFYSASRLYFVIHRKINYPFSEKNE